MIQFGLSIIAAYLLFMPMGLSKDLPKRPYQQAIKFSPISAGKEIMISGTVTIPNQQAAKLTAPSSVIIYEKIGSSWEESEKFNFTNGSTKNKLQLNRKISLSKIDSAFAIHLTVVHCHKTGQGLCVIDYFQGVVQRDLKLTAKEVTFQLVATDPKSFN